MSEVAKGTIPDALLERDQWLCWRAEERNGKATKVPIDPHTGSFGSSTDPETWSDFETARRKARAESDLGLGFVFAEADPFVGVDLDDCRDSGTGQPEEWAKEIVRDLDSYTEVSPSGSGYHVIVEGTLPEGGNRSGSVELYETARFFTVTGEHVEGTPEGIKERTAALESVHTEHVASGPEKAGDGTAGGGHELTDTELLERAKTAANGEKFRRLWNGSTAGYESHSEADMALASMLAFWTGGEEGRVDRLFRRSGLMRPKWDERHFSDGSTYGERTVERAIRGTTEFYSPTEGDENTEREDGKPGAANANGERGPRLDDRLVALEADVERLEARVDDLAGENENLRRALEDERARHDALVERIEKLEARGGESSAESESGGFVRQLFEW
jgi:primase-polymerase (primpol)-like protein